MHKRKNTEGEGGDTNCSTNKKGENDPVKTGKRY